MLALFQTNILILLERSPADSKMVSAVPEN